MKELVRKLVATAAWAGVFSFGAVMIGGGLVGLWGGYHLRRGNNPINNSQLMHRVASLVATTPKIGALVGLTLGLMGKLPGTRDSRNAE